MKKTLQRADGGHCVSEKFAAAVQEVWIIPSRIGVINPAIDPDVFRPSKESSLSNQVFRIIIAGGLQWAKGHEFALLALQKLRDRGIAAKMAFVGDGRERQRIIYTVHDLGPERMVELKGRLNPEQIREEFQKSDVFLSSISEGISNAAIEAMVCELPVVSTDCGGMAEAVSDGVEGFIVPVRDANAMCEVLVRLALNPPLREKMGKAGIASLRSFP